LARLGNSNVVTFALGPNFHERFTAFLVYSIRYCTLRVFDILVIDLGNYISHSQTRLIGWGIRRYLRDDGPLDVRRYV
jgi:hypothetical protein